MKLHSAGWLGIGLLALIFAGCSKAGKSAHTIEIAGSTSVTPLMELLAAEYEQAQPKIKININGTGSSDGIKAAAAGTSELGMSSRELGPAEKGAGLDEWIIAIDGIVLIVHPSNPLGDLTKDQIREIYSGGITDWSELGEGKTGKIAVVSREPGSGTRGAFEELIGLKDQLVLGATEFDGTGAIKAEISRNPDAIGYISLGSLDPLVQGIAIGGIAPTPDNVRNGSYLLARPFILLSKKSISPETKQFLDWILSAPGQRIVSKTWISVL